MSIYFDGFNYRTSARRRKNPVSRKKVGIAGAIAVGVAAIGVGVYFLTKTKHTTTPTPPNTPPITPTGETCQVSVLAVPTAGGTVTPSSGEYAQGQPLIFVAHANTGYQFVDWTLGGAEISRSPSLTLTPTSNINSLTANFNMVSDIRLPTALIPVPPNPSDHEAPPGFAWPVERRRGTIYGLVRDASTGLPVKNTSITVESIRYPYGETYHEVSGDDGTYYIEKYGVAVGTYLVSWTGPSYILPTGERLYYENPEGSGSYAGTNYAGTGFTVVTIAEGEVLRFDIQLIPAKQPGVIEYTGEKPYPGQ